MSRDNSHYIRDYTFEDELLDAVVSMKIGMPVFVFKELDSTNDLLKDWATSNCPEGTVVMAYAQSDGHGQRGRSWISVKDKGLYLSFLLRPDWPIQDTSWLGVLTGLAVADTLEAIGLKEVGIKWPNDFLVNGKKVGGILVEPRAKEGKVEFAVIGIGINLFHEAADWVATELNGQATSLLMEGVKVSYKDFVIMLLKQLESYYERAEREHNQALFKTWAQRCGVAELPRVEGM